MLLHWKVLYHEFLFDIGYHMQYTGLERNRCIPANQPTVSSGTGVIYASVKCLIGVLWFYLIKIGSIGFTNTCRDLCNQN